MPRPDESGSALPPDRFVDGELEIYTNNSKLLTPYGGARPWLCSVYVGRWLPFGFRLVYYMYMTIERHSFFLVVLITTCLLIGLYPLNHTHAALLYLDPGEATLYRGDTVTIGLRIDTDEGECINTVDTVIKYDPSIRAVDVSKGQSILNLWVEDPKIDEENHTITLAGGLPGGYCGRIAGDPSLTNIIAELVFRSPGLSIGGGEDPQANIWIDGSSQVLLHDGLGTPSALRTEGAVLTLLPSAGGTTDDSWSTLVSDDDTPPADFVITLSRDEYAFSGRYFISFNSQDKQSGIDHYEVMEEPIEDLYAFKWGGVDAPWVVAESPYVLEDQTLNRTIRVKAIDKAGNETISVLVPDEALRSLSRDRILTWIVVSVVLIIVLGLAGFALWRRRNRLLETYDHEVSP